MILYQFLHYFHIAWKYQRNLDQCLQSVRVSMQDGLFTKEFSLPCWICQWTKAYTLITTSKIFHRINRQLGPLSGHGTDTMGHRFKPIESNYGIPTCLIRLSKRLEWFIIRLCQTIWRSFVVSGECRSPKSSRETHLIFTRVVIKDLACEFFARRAKSGNHFDSLNLVRSRVIGETGWSRFFECHWLSRIVIEWNFIDIPRISKWY